MIKMKEGETSPIMKTQPSPLSLREAYKNTKLGFNKNCWNSTIRGTDINETEVSIKDINIS